MSKAKEDADLSRTELYVAEDDKGTLLKKLVETEMDARAASEQLVKMRDTVRKLKQVGLRNKLFYIILFPEVVIKKSF